MYISTSFEGSRLNVRYHWSGDACEHPGEEVRMCLLSDRKQFRVSLDFMKAIYRVLQSLLPEGEQSLRLANLTLLSFKAVTIPLLTLVVSSNAILLLCVSWYCTSNLG
jgi:hypothetical protein